MKRPLGNLGKMMIGVFGLIMSHSSFGFDHIYNHRILGEAYCEKDACWGTIEKDRMDNPLSVIQIHASAHCSVRSARLPNMADIHRLAEGLGSKSFIKTRSNSWRRTIFENYNVKLGRSDFLQEKITTIWLAELGTLFNFRTGNAYQLASTLALLFDPSKIYEQLNTQEGILCISSEIHEN